MIEQKDWITNQRPNIVQKFEHVEFIAKKLIDRETAFKSFQEGVFGYIIQAIWQNTPSKILHHLVLRLCATSTKEELRFLINEEEVKFGYREFAMITGLKCDPIPNLDLKALNKGDSFKDRFFPEAKKVRIEALKMFLNSPIQVSDEDMVRLANLYLLEIFFLAKSEHSLVDLKHLLIANDLQAFNDYPWGRVIFEETAQQVINANRHSSTAVTGYAMAGCAYALLAFAFETIPALRKKNYTKRNDIQHLQRLVNWVYVGNPHWQSLETNIFGAKNVSTNNFTYSALCLSLKSRQK